MRDHFIRNLHVDGMHFYRSYTSKRKIPKGLFNFKNFFTASNQELGSWFHSFVFKTSIETILKLHSYLMLFVLVLARNKDKIYSLDLSLCLYHSYGIKCTAKLRDY